MRQRIEDAGLRWAVLDGMPAEWKHKIKLGLPGRDEQIANWCRTLENMGAAGVPALGYFFSPRSSIGHYGLRTSRSTPGRGGAIGHQLRLGVDPGRGPGVLGPAGRPLPGGDRGRRLGRRDLLPGGRGPVGRKTPA